MGQHHLLTSLALAAFCLPAPVQAQTDDSQAQIRARALVAAMRPEEKVVLTDGIMPIDVGLKRPTPPADALVSAGYVNGIARLGIPPLREVDASLGLGWYGGARKGGATAMPSGLAQASSWNPQLLREGGTVIGAEGKALGFNVMLSGGANLIRDPRVGRAFEYLSEDPLLTGVLVGHAVAGIQSSHVIATMKHVAVNGQETGRKLVSSTISDSAARESDLLAFQIGIEIGRPGAVMCGYNLVNGAPSCSSDHLLNRVLKHDWGYKGFVMSDWGAVPDLGAALNGLDQQSAAELDGGRYFAGPLLAAAARDRRYTDRLDDMNRRILWAMQVNGLFSDPARPGGTIDFAAHARVAQEAASEGIVLLRNQGNILPLARTAKRIAVIGGYANVGVPAGGGSSLVQGSDGPAITLPSSFDGIFAGFIPQTYHRSAPLAAIRAMAPDAAVSFRDGTSIADAVALARQADVAIVFAPKWSTEGKDQGDLSLPAGQDELIAAVAAANPKTIVVLETGNPVTMPWLDHAAAVLEAWYPGIRGGEAIASVLFGTVNPSGHLPITFPASTAQLPRPAIDGYDAGDPTFIGDTPVWRGLTVNYDIEGSDVGYRWNARQGNKALFPFGFGLSYTSFESSGLTIEGLKARFTIRNTGQRAGATVGQLYLVGRPQGKEQRLVGFSRVMLAPGESREVTLDMDPRLLADWRKDHWALAPGRYSFALGSDAEHLGPQTWVTLSGRSWQR